jgi:hypothetical protein
MKDNDCDVMVVQGQDLIKYLEGLQLKADKVQTSTSGKSATLALIAIQFIAEVLDSKIFQKALSSILSSSFSGNNLSEAVQIALLKFSDELLQLYALSSFLQLNNSETPSSALIADTISISLRGKQMSVSSHSLGRVFSSGSFDLLITLQQLLDIPTFITIFQVNLFLLFLLCSFYYLVVFSWYRSCYLTRIPLYVRKPFKCYHYDWKTCQQRLMIHWLR